MKRPAHEYGKKEIIILVVIALLGVLFFLLKENILSIGPEPIQNTTGMFSVELKDANGSVLGYGNSGMNSIVGGIANIKTATFKVSIVNTGDVDIEARLTDAKPSQLYAAFNMPQTARQLKKGGEGIWVSAPIDLSQFGNQSVHFTATAEIKFGDKQSTTITKSSTLILDIDNSDIITNASNTTAGTNLCDTVSCPDRCEGYHRLMTGGCFISGNITALCNYGKIDWYADACGWTPNQNTVCGDGTCSQNECCYILNTSQSDLCVTGASICTDVFNSCNIDCKHNYASVQAIIFGE